MCYISPICGEAPTGPIRPKSCMVGDVHDIITCAKFQIEIFVGYNFTWEFYRGGFSIFLLIFSWALQQCSANALPVIIIIIILLLFLLVLLLSPTTTTLRKARIISEIRFLASTAAHVQRKSMYPLNYTDDPG